MEHEVEKREIEEVKLVVVDIMVSMYVFFFIFCI